MIEKRDIPKEVHAFHEAFMKLYGGGYKHDVSQLFSDFLNVSISNFQLEPNPELEAEINKRYSPEEVVLLGKLFQQWVLSMNEIMGEGDGFDWYDILGVYYEALNHGFKRSAFGQFFTPETIVKMMGAMMFPASDNPDKIQSISDPCSGSGRFLLEAHCQLKARCICYGEDIDAMCAKMTVLNCLVHGVEAEVIHHNSLMPESFNAGWYVNAGIKKGGMPNIRRITAEDSRVIGMWKRVREEQPEKQKEQVKILEEKYSNRQLNMFS